MIIVANMMHMKRAIRPIMTAKRIGIMSLLFDGVLLSMICPVEVNVPLEMSIDPSGVVSFIDILIFFGVLVGVFGVYDIFNGEVHM